MTDANRSEANLGFGRDPNDFVSDDKLPETMERVMNDTAQVAPRSYQAPSASKQRARPSRMTNSGGHTETEGSFSL